MPTATASLQATPTQAPPAAFAELNAVIDRVRNRVETELRPIVMGEIYSGVNFAARVGLFPFQIVRSDVDAIASGQPEAIVSVGLALESKAAALVGNPRTAIAFAIASWGVYLLGHWNASHVPDTTQPGGAAPVVVSLPPMWLRDP